MKQVSLDFKFSNFTTKYGEMNLGIEFGSEISIIYVKNNTYYAHINSKNNNSGINLYLNLNFINTNNIENYISHELNHIYTKYKGLTTKPDYSIALNIKNSLPQEKYPYTFKLFDAIYMAQETEISAVVNELYKEIINLNITSNEDFNNFIKNHYVYKVASFLENINLRQYIDNLVDEDTINLLMDEFNVDDLYDWMKKLKYF